MNTPPIGPECSHIVHVAKTVDEHEKSRFIRTCDAMLHARSSGETFGLAVGEFSAHNRPVITSRAHTDHETARMHLDILGERGWYYSSKDELIRLLLAFEPRAWGASDHNAYRPYAPHRVMEAFDQVFVRGPARKELPEWKRWSHGGKAGRGGGGGARARPRPPSDPAERARMLEAWERDLAARAECDMLRGLPAEEEVAVGGGAEAPHSYVVLSDEGAVVRLAPSQSAAATGAMLARGERFGVVASRGRWLRLANGGADDAAPGGRWLLGSHPTEGDLARRCG